MYKKFFIIIMVFFLFTTLNPYSLVNADDSLPQRVLLIYDDEDIISTVEIIKELIGAYNAKAYLVNNSTYISGKINNYDYIIIVCNKNISSDIIEDLLEYRGEVFWIGNGVNKIISDDMKIEIVDEKISSIKNITYNQNILSNDFWGDGDKSIQYSIFEVDKINQVYSYVDNGKKLYPNIWRYNNIWNMTILPENKNLLFILSDILNDYFKTSIHNESGIFIKLNNIHIFRDIEKLKVISEYLNSENIPFIISIILTYIDSDTGSRYTMFQLPGFLETIKYMQYNGGSIIININKGNDDNIEATDEDYNYSIYDLEDIIKQCILNEIYPLGFEFYDNKGNYNSYKKMKKYFSTYVGKYYTQEKIKVEYPYILKNTENFNILLPENLDGLNINNIDFLVDVRESFEALSIVRGYNGGISIDSDLDIEYIKELVQFFKKNNVRFNNIRNKNNWIYFTGISIRSEEEAVRVNINGEKGIYSYKNINIKNSERVTLNKLNIILTIIVFLFIIIIIAILKYYLNISQKKATK